MHSGMPCVVIAKSTNWILFTGGVSEFFICCGNGFLHTKCPHNRHIKATELIVEQVSLFVAIRLIVFILWHFVFPLSDFRLGRDMLCSLGGSCGPLNLVEIRLSSGIDLS